MYVLDQTQPNYGLETIDQLVTYGFYNIIYYIYQ